MNNIKNKEKNIKLAYIGGGSRGWAWRLMSDLADAEEIGGDVYLYDIDFDAAYKNEIIGNKFNLAEGAKTVWNYKAVKTIGEALTDADFVIISIMPGTFDEMYSDVHTPEKYGIYQSVGDSVGPGGIIRSLRTIPMMEEIAKAVEKYCPDAWVINYTNPMSVCVKTLYEAFPKIKAFGCCHEVFGTQEFLLKAVKDVLGIEDTKRNDMQVNVVGVNHFTWFTKAVYKNVDIFPIYREFCEKFGETGYFEKTDNNWANKDFPTSDKVKMNLFKKYGYIAAAGDRHLAEFFDGNWFLKDPETVKEWKFRLTTVDWRKQDLKERLERCEKLISGEEEIKIELSGEEGVNQIKALMGLGKLVTNCNIPNQGQIPNLPLGTIVETNCAFSADSLQPLIAGNVPDEIYPLVSRVCGLQNQTVEAGMERNLEKAFRVFENDPLVTIPPAEARKLFDEMIENTKEYLTEYKK